MCSVHKYLTNLHIEDVISIFLNSYYRKYSCYNVLLLFK